jgi:hypothetical protein
MRSPRRTFAAPFVITSSLAACTATVVERPPPSNPPPSNPPPTAVVVETPPHAEPVVINANPPPPEERPVVVEDRTWVVYMHDNKCTVGTHASCPKNEPGKPMHTCNPPPPRPYECPRGMANNEQLTIEQRGDSCMIPSPHVNCPAGAMCNPPPPRSVPCPK